ncbi:MAG: ATP-binding protein [Aliivibrio sp.]|uniref:ATP-binding protein n=1 Tax=Aliivibrio sp. TaxID=1872443 RepID=UPI001A5595DF|nr:ATP-binding protein [Aliivibrio sp.]
MTIFNFNDNEALGKVASVDTATVIVEVNDAEQLKRLQVNRLAVLQSSKPGQHLIGVINQVTRKKLIVSPIDENDEEQYSEQNLCKVSLIGSLIDADGTKRNVFRRTLESVPEIDANCFALEGEKLTSFMRVISHAEADGNSLTLGKYTLDENAVAYLNGNKFFQRHAFIGGSTGAGKSWATARIIEQVAELKNSNAIVFDLHGEYSPLKGDGISHYKVAGPGDIDAKRTLADGAIYLPYWLLSYEALVSLFVDRSDQNAPNQAMLMAREVNVAKTNYLTAGGYKDILDNFTIDSPVPFDLTKLLQSLNDINVEQVPGARAGTTKAGEFNGKLSRMISRLENKISDRRLGFLFQGGDDVLKFDWLNRLADALLGCNDEKGNGGVKIINFSEVPSDVLPLIVSLVARLAFSVQQWTPSDTRHPVAIFCDEAHLYIPNRNTAATDDISIQIFERIAKEGRKYGVSLVVITQRPSEVNKTILSQCSNFVAMRLTNSDDQAVIKKLLPDSLGGFSDILPTLDTGEALVVGDASLLPSRIRIDEPINKPDSGTIDFWKEWQGEVTKGRLGTAVDNWRKQSIQ